MAERDNVIYEALRRFKEDCQTILYVCSLAEAEIGIAVIGMEGPGEVKVG
jgi:hypothetical protein